MKARLVTLALIIVALAVAGCGNKPGKPLTIIDGTLALRGSMPNPDLVLEADEGPDVLLEADDFATEMRMLRGMRVSIQGDAESKLKNDMIVLKVKRYTLLRLPSGEMPVMGWLEVDGVNLILHGGDGKKYWIRGDLEGVIRDFKDAKIWVVGTLGELGAGSGAPPNTIPYWVTGYGVLQQAR